MSLAKSYQCNYNFCFWLFSVTLLRKTKNLVKKTERKTNFVEGVKKHGFQFLANAVIEQIRKA